MIFCKNCCSKKIALPQLDYKSNQRVCDSCLIDLGPKVTQTNFQNEYSIKAQNHLRETSFKFNTDLKEMGRRIQSEKCYFLCSNTETKEELLITMIHLFQEDLTYKLEKKNLERLSKVLKSIKHPYIAPTTFSTVVDNEFILIMRPFYDNCLSLKDKIYKVKSSKMEYQKKYSGVGKGLPATEIATYGRQILEGKKNI
jgi:hypothetical protein